ncbi:hypothetical protein H2248_007349 [Termitomyces sp. 'cryptogamus']|nr:hypothetical protein H2248_007349 [Termitomyces sp. 'cryptogamus']
MLTTSKTYLLENGSSDPEDALALKAFLDNLEKAKGFQDLLPFLVQRSVAKVNNGGQQLWKVCSGSWDSIRKSGCGASHFRSTSETCRRILESGIPFSDTPEAYQAFIRLVKACGRLMNCHLLFETSHPNEWLNEQQRRFHKTAQYYDGGFIITFWRKYQVRFVSDTIPIVPIVQLRTRTIEETHVDAISQCISVSWSLRNFTGKLTMYYPDGWDNFGGRLSQPPSALMLKFVLFFT